MEQFDILGALEAAAIAKGYKFIFGYDRFYDNIEAIQQYSNGELVLIADFKILPSYSGVKYSNLQYTCLMMLGRKFDANGLSSDLDENFEQKYNRRIKDLLKFLADFIGEFACDNELDLTPAQIVPLINKGDENIDFVMANNVIFNQ